VVASDAVLLALSSSQKIGLAIVAGCFIGFALLSSFLIPRYRPDYPGGKGLRWFVAAVLVLTAGMLSAVVFIARETKGESEAALVSNAVGATKPIPTTAPGAPKGNPAAGKQLFSANGCTACHTYTPAGSSATVGPNLDNLAVDAQKANRGPLDQYTAESIEDPNAYVVPGFAQGVMPGTFGQTLSKAQIADLVAFLTQKS
jgi:mono/diheme cytochrome c family protein